MFEEVIGTAAMLGIVFENIAVVRVTKTVNIKNVFKCQSCQYSTDKKKKLSQHTLSHTKPFVCNKCDERFGRSYALD